MILPGSFSASLALVILTMVCWGSWASAFKSTDSKWRFELFYFDFAIGALAAAIVIGLTLGSFGFDGFSFIDDIRLAGKRQDVYTFSSGAVFNLGNMLLLAAVSVSGMAVAIPLALGTGLIVDGLWSLVFHLGYSLPLLLEAVVVIGAALIVNILASRMHRMANLVAQIEKGKTKSTRKTVSSKGVILSLVGGLFLGSFMPLLGMGMVPDLGLGPYSAGFIFVTGILVTTFVFNLFFMNLPVEGEPIDVVDYFRAKLTRHGAGILGGIVWYMGLIASLVVTRAEGPAQIANGLRFAIAQAAAVVGLIWGVAVWKEFAGADHRVRLYLGLTVLFLAGGIGLMASAQSLAAAPPH